MTRGLLRSANTRGRQSSHDVMVLNISLHGVGIISPVELHDGEYCHIEIGVGPLHLSSRVLVRRCTARADGYFEVGGEFC